MSCPLLLLGLGPAAVVVRPAAPYTWSDAWTDTKLQGSTWRLTLDVGRLQNTRMPAEWAASGARLSLPIEVTFGDKPVPGGEMRWDVDEPACCPAKQLQATAGSFVGKDGEESVAVRAGGWLAEPADRCGMRVLRAYLDFPDGAARNDAVLPAGRVFFRAACWDGDALSATIAEAKAVKAKLDAALGRPSAGADAGEHSSADHVFSPAKLLERARVDYVQGGAERAETLRFHHEILERSLPDEHGVLSGPGGVQLAAAGLLSVQANGPFNLWGALGYRFHTIGRVSFAPVERSEAL